MERAPMTPGGRDRLHEELRKLKNVERPKIIKEIAVAREHGDLKENAEYQYAKEKQSFIEGRILEVEDRLSRSEVIEIFGDPEKVTFGCMVTVVDAETDKKSVYKIVGKDEADIKVRKISYESPIAKALINKSEGDVVEFRAPGGLRELEIVSLSAIRD